MGRSFGIGLIVGLSIIGFGCRSESNPTNAQDIIQATVDAAERATATGQPTASPTFTSPPSPGLSPIRVPTLTATPSPTPKPTRIATPTANPDSDKAACSEAKEVLRDVDRGVYTRIGVDTGRLALLFDLRNILLDNEADIEITIGLSAWANSVNVMDREANDEAILRLAEACRDHGGIFSRDI